MANTLYDKARERFLKAQLNWLSDTVKCILVDTGAYTPNFSTHEFLSDIPSGARIGSTAGIALTNQAVVAGAADADDVTFSSVTGASIEALVLFKFGTTDADSPLICYIDTATGLPITPNGGDIIITWDNGANRIFKP
jgi:hypothetical protein